MVNENSSVGETFRSAESSWLPMTELKIGNKVSVATQNKKIVAENRDTVIIGENSPHVFWASQARNTISGQHTIPDTLWVSQYVANTKNTQCNSYFNNLTLVPLLKTGASSLMLRSMVRLFLHYNFILPGTLTDSEWTQCKNKWRWIPFVMQLPHWPFQTA